MLDVRTNERRAQLPHESQRHSLVVSVVETQVVKVQINSYLSDEDEVGATGNIAVAVHRVPRGLNYWIVHHWSNDPAGERRSEFYAYQANSTARQRGGCTQSSDCETQLFFLAYHTLP